MAAAMVEMAAAILVHARALWAGTKRATAG